MIGRVKQIERWCICHEPIRQRRDKCTAANMFHHQHIGNADNAFASERGIDRDAAVVTNQPSLHGNGYFVGPSFVLPKIVHRSLVIAVEQADVIG